jgi:hypothetical protein
LILTLGLAVLIKTFLGKHPWESIAKNVLGKTLGNLINNGDYNNLSNGSNPEIIPPIHHPAMLKKD